MANRYWVGGTDSWDATAGSKWALTSGGTGGEAVPTSSDDVFLDANSGAVTVTVSGTRECNNLDFTGFTGGFAGSGTPRVYGNFVGTNITSTLSGGVQFAATTAKNVTCNGMIFSGASLFFTFFGAGGTWTLQDTFSTTAGINVAGGTFDANNQVVNIKTLTSSGSTVRTIVLGTGLWTFSSTGSAVEFTGTNLTLTEAGSTLKIISEGVTTKVFLGGGETFNDVIFTGTGSGDIRIGNSNTFNTLTIAPYSLVVRVRFDAGTTQTCNSFVNQGNTSRNILKSNTDGSAWTLSVASGTVVITNASLQDSTATGGATFWAYGTTDVSGNTGWNFSGLSGFFAFM